MTKEKMVVAYVCDARYRRLLEISMNSVRRYNKNVEFAVLAREDFHIPGARVYTFQPHAHLFKFKEHDRMQEGVYYKLYLPLLPYDKILYMDCDTICQRPLDELWNMRCDFITTTESHEYGKLQAAELGVKRWGITGMMVMNLKELRKADFTARCLRYVKETPSIPWHDETTINAVFGDRLKFVDVKWDYCRNRRYERPIPESDAYILHYIGTRNKRLMSKMSDFAQLRYIKPLLEGKTVAIVGNASSLLQKNQGAEIDSHDIVIRFNKGFPSDAVGHRTHLVFLACTITEGERLKYRHAYTIRRSNLCKNYCNFEIHPTDRTRFAQLPCAAVQKRSPGKLSQASTGFIAIQFALSCDCKSIDLYGFDFFKSDTYYNPTGYVTLHNGDKEAEKILEYEKYGLLNIK